MAAAQMAYVRVVNLTISADCKFSRALLEEVNESISDLHRHLSCVVCCQLLTDPFQPIGRRCGHYVCRLCIRGPKRLYPSCAKCQDCRDFRTYEETRVMTLLLLCYKSVCVHILINPLFYQLHGFKPRQNMNVTKPSIRLPRMSTQGLIYEGSNYDDIMYTFLFDTDLPLFSDKLRSSSPPTKSELEIESHFDRITAKRRVEAPVHQMSRPPHMRRRHHFRMSRNEHRKRYSYNRMQSLVVRNSSTQTQEAPINIQMTSKQTQSTADLQMKPMEPINKIISSTVTKLMQKETESITNNLNAAIIQNETVVVNENQLVAVQKVEIVSQDPITENKIKAIAEKEKFPPEIPLRSIKPIIVSSVQIKPPDKVLSLATGVNPPQPDSFPVENKVGKVSKTSDAKKRKHCRCGVFQGQGTLKTCRNNRCFCYTNGYSCADCVCQGCKNPHKQDYVDTDAEDEVEEPIQQLEQTPGDDMFTTSIVPSKGLILVAISDPRQSDYPLVLVQNEDNKVQCFNVFKDGVPIDPAEVGFHRVELESTCDNQSTITTHAYMAYPPQNPMPEESCSQSFLED